MVGPGTIVTECLARVRPEEHGTGMMNFVDIPLRIFNGKFQVLGSNPISHFTGFVNGRRYDDGSAVIEAG